MQCIPCNIETCYGCVNPTEDGVCCCGETSQVRSESLIAKLDGEKRPVGRPELDGEDMSNALKNGRNRALRKLKIPKGTVCEWSGLKFAGGGIRPIIGCAGLPAKARHHGPDKSTLNNELGVNLHAICTTCHARWHAYNNEFYDERPLDGSPFVPRPDAGENHKHDPETKATVEEIFKNEITWNSPANVRRQAENSDLTDELEYGTLNTDTEETDTSDDTTDADNELQ